MSLKASELILNNEGSLYHLNLKPGEVAETIITVGDPERVSRVSSYFDTIELKKRQREFVTHTGTLGGKRITVISTGIGPDNIDIIINEIDCLFNVDLENRAVKKDRVSLRFIRIGTSGSVQKEILPDSFILSDSAIGLDNLVYFYQFDKVKLNHVLGQAFAAHLGSHPSNSSPYAVDASKELITRFERSFFTKGITLTSPGFYGPQGRSLRIPLANTDFISEVGSFRYFGERITNFEMETAALYAMASLLGHHALSLNAILANRVSGHLSSRPGQTIDRLIEKTLEILTE